VHTHKVLLLGCEMEDILSEQTKSLMTEKKIIINENENETMCTRFLRKKYKCVMLWFLSIIAFSQLLIIIFDKFIDEEIFKKILEKISNSNSSRTILH
jgi:hypothetical protein